MYSVWSHGEKGQTDPFSETKMKSKFEKRVKDVLILAVLVKSWFAHH